MSECLLGGRKRSDVCWSPIFTIGCDPVLKVVERQQQRAVVHAAVPTEFLLLAKLSSMPLGQVGSSCVSTPFSKDSTTSPAPARAATGRSLRRDAPRHQHRHSPRRTRPSGRCAKPRLPSAPAPPGGTSAPTWRGVDRRFARRCRCAPPCPGGAMVARSTMCRARRRASAAATSRCCCVG